MLVPQDETVGVVIEMQQLRTLPYQHWKPAAKDDPQHSSEAFGPVFDGAESGLGPIR